METPRMNAVAREWIIFAICLGLGGHIVLGLILHAPEAWPWNKAGTVGLLIGLSVYVVVQVGRSALWVYKGKTKRDRNHEQVGDA